MKMKLELVAAAILSMVGTTLADEESVCTLELSEDEEMHSKLGRLATNCLATSEYDLGRLKHVDTVEGFHTFLRGYCENQPRYRTCLDDVTHHSEVCQNATRQQVFLILRDSLEAFLETVCNNEDLMASLFIGYRITLKDETQDGPLSDCIRGGDHKIRLVFELQNFDISAKIYFLYKELVHFRDCSKDSRIGDLEFRENLHSFMTKITERLKCIHPQDNTTVLCSTIEGPGFCPIRQDEVESRPTSELILDELAVCIRKIIPDESNTTEENTDLQTHRALYKDFCEKRKEVKTCLYQVVVLSTLCSEKNLFDVIEMFGALTLEAMESGCVDDGEPLAILTHSIAREANGSTGHPNSVMECVHAGATALISTETEDLDTKTRVLHRQLGALKHCIVGKLRGDPRAVFYVDLLFNGLLRKMSCVDPESNATVLCEVLQPSLAPLHCNLVTDDDATFSIFTDMVFTCLRISTIDLSHVGEFRELDEFENFFRRYCEDHTRTTNCFKDVAANFKVCSPTHLHHIVYVLTDLPVEILESGCEGEANMLGSTMYGMRKHRELLVPCTLDVGRRIRKIESDERNTTAITVGIFNSLIDFTECYSKNLPEEGGIKAKNLAFLRQVLKRLECINDDGSVVHCETFVNAVHTD